MEELALGLLGSDGGVQQSLAGPQQIQPKPSLFPSGALALNMWSKPAWKKNKCNSTEALPVFSPP